MRFTLFSLLALGACLLASGCGGGARTIELSGPTMGTTWSVKLPALPEGVERREVRRGVEALLAGINRRMSTYDEASDLSRLNRAPAGEWVVVPAELAAVLAAARDIGVRSGGAFDITVGPLVNLWGFGPRLGPDRIPDDAEIEETRALTGLHQFELRDEPPAVRKRHARVYLDLSAIAKGYAVDRVAGYLNDIGASDYLVEIGGELKARGRNAGGEPWRIAVEAPLTDRRAVQRVLRITDHALASSGDYRNYFDYEGERYSHTIDPRTGRPVRHALAAATVVHDSAMQADAWATALLVLGPRRAMGLARELELAALLILRTEDGYTERMTPAFEPFVADAPSP